MGPAKCCWNRFDKLATRDWQELNLSRWKFGDTLFKFYPTYIYKSNLHNYWLFVSKPFFGRSPVVKFSFRWHGRNLLHTRPTCRRGHRPPVDVLGKMCRRMGSTRGESIHEWIELIKKRFWIEKTINKFHKSYRDFIGYTGNISWDR